MDRLEKYIQTHRDQFDDRNPDPAIWDQIATRLPQKRDEHRHIAMWRWMSAVAVALALVMCGVVAGMYMGNNRVAQNPAYAEFMQAQQYYDVEYNKKKSELSQYVYDPVLDKDLQELDKMYEALSQEFLNTKEPDKTELINAMIQIYKTRIELLERVLNRIEQNKDEKQLQYEDENVKI
ncbi:MAG TPA: hypothetical protein VI603_14695 [Saprospiraceae bacterium]|nr:hypothetical protein [Saprospiraceae bacterium]